MEQHHMGVGHCHPFPRGVPKRGATPHVTQTGDTDGAESPRGSRAESSLEHEALTWHRVTGTEGTNGDKRGQTGQHEGFGGQNESRRLRGRKWGTKQGGNRRLGSRQGGDGDLGTFLQERGRNETEGGKREKNLLLENLCWPESTWGCDTPEGVQLLPSRGWRIKFHPRTNTGAPKQGEWPSLSPVLVTPGNLLSLSSSSFPTDFAAPAPRIWKICWGYSHRTWKGSGKWEFSFPFKN